MKQNKIVDDNINSSKCIPNNEFSNIVPKVLNLRFFRFNCYWFKINGRRHVKWFYSFA